MIDPNSCKRVYSGSCAKHKDGCSTVHRKDQKHRNESYCCPDLTFGCYSPSFGRGPEQTRDSFKKDLFSEDNFVNTRDYKSKTIRSPTLMKQLFGVSNNTPSSSRGNSLKPLCATYGNNAKYHVNNSKSSKDAIIKNQHSSCERRFVNSNRHNLQHTTSADSD